MLRYTSILHISLLCFCLSAVPVKAQLPDIKWAFSIGIGYTSMVDLVVDKAGNTYVALNYQSKIEIPGLKKTFPFAGHIHGLIVKISPTGKPIWAHGIKSAYQNLVSDLAIAPDGDLLVTGHGDGLVYFPGLKDTLIVGVAKKPDEYNNPYGLYTARYSAAGERKWVQFWECARTESLSVAANSSNEVYMSYFHEKKLTQSGKTIDTIMGDTRKKHSLAVFTPEGQLKEIINTNFQVKHLEFDSLDNMVCFGSFRGKIRFTDKDIFTNDAYYESHDAYIAKYDKDWKFLWAKKIGGQSSQDITGIVIAPDLSIYLTGWFSMECFLGTGIKVIQKSKYEWKSGYSFFYMHIFDDGEPDFVHYIDNPGYNSYFMGRSIAMDANHHIHIIGQFNDTLSVDGLQAMNDDEETGFYSRWEDGRMTRLAKIGESAQSWIHAGHIDIEGYIFAGGGDYYDQASITVNGKKATLKSIQGQRAVYLFGGTIPKEVKQLKKPTSKDSTLKNNMLEVKPLLACENHGKDTSGNLWFPNADSVGAKTVSIVQSPCGNIIEGMEATLFPNPTTGEFNVRLKGIKGVARIDIFSETGQTLLSHRLEDVANDHVVSFDISGSSSGTYIVRITHKNYEKAFRLIKIE
jgi:hypothetical protein